MKKYQEEILGKTISISNWYNPKHFHIPIVIGEFSLLSMFEHDHATALGVVG